MCILMEVLCYGQGPAASLRHPHPVWSLPMAAPDLELDLGLEVTLLSPSQPCLEDVQEVMPSVSHSANTPEGLFWCGC